MSGDHMILDQNLPRATLRDGIALPIALAAIVVVGALIAGVFFASTQEYRVGRNTMAAHTALHAAEVGLNKVVSTWTPAQTQQTTVGQTVKLPLDTIDKVAIVQVQYTRVSPTMFWVTSTAVAGSGSLQARALKRLNSLVRVDIPDMRIQGAITVRGNVTVAGSAKASGNDSTPKGWTDCNEGAQPAAAVVVADSATNATGGGGCSGWACLTGATNKVVDSAIYADTNTYKNFGGFSYDSLTKLATWTFTGGTLPGTGKTAPSWTGVAPNTVCDRTNQLNWGDTSRADTHSKACDDYFPVIWLKGATTSWTLANYGGQGILLIDGNATINGQFVWTGLVLVQGTLDYSGMNSPKLTGAVMVMNRNNGVNKVAGNVTIQYSRCAIQAVTARLATARQTRYRAWADMSF
jgi:hypothetical protein